MKSSLFLVALLGTFSVTVSKISITKCCPADQNYILGHNDCKTSSINPPIPVVSSSSRKQSLYDINELNVTENLTQCPDGFIVQTAGQFLFFDDGTLNVPAISSKFRPGTFCIDTSDNSPVARFCLRDPCKENSCVKKCCPEGYTFDDKSCVPSTSAFALNFKNETGDDQDVSKSAYVIRAGLLPNCMGADFSLMDPFAYPEDEFFILPSGELFIPTFNHRDAEYCVEDFIVINNGTESHQRKALRCLMPVNDPLSESERLVLIAYAYLLLLTSLFLIATFVVYLIIPEIRNIHGVTVMCHCASLAGTFISLAIILLKSDFDTPSCVTIGVFTHFFFLSSFTWLNVLSFDIWWTLRVLRPTTSIRGAQNRRIKGRFAFYSIYAWGIPLIIVAIGRILDHAPGIPDHVLKPEIGVYKCWFPGGREMLPYLYGPIAVLLVSNIVFFILTAIRLHQAQKDTSIARKHKKKKEKTKIIFSLFLLMGITWVTEIISWASNGSIYYSIPTDILNIMTGVFIFVIFVCKKKVRRLLVKKLHPARKAIRRGQQSMLSSFSTRNTSFWRNKSVTYEPRDMVMSEFATKETSLQEIDLSN